MAPHTDFPRHLWLLNLSWQDGLGRTPLIYSLSKGQTDVAKMLLRHPKPYVGIRDPDSRTPSHLAAETGIIQSSGSF
jgi:ankyrin repeat protein